MPACQGMEEAVRKRLNTAQLLDLRSIRRDLKQQGEVKLYACTFPMFICGVKPEDLIGEIDEPRGLTSFLLEEMSEADQVLTF